MCEISVYEDKILLHSIVSLGSAYYCGSESLSYANIWDHDFFIAPLFFPLSYSILFFSLYSSLASKFLSLVFNLLFLNYLCVCFLTSPSPPRSLSVPVGKENGAKLIFSHSADENPEAAQRDSER